MKAVRPLAVALAAVAVGFACDRSPTGVPQPPEPNSQLVSSSSSWSAPTGPLSCSVSPDGSVTPVIKPETDIISGGPRCSKPMFKLQAPTYDRRSGDHDRQSNYAVAW